MRNPLPLLLGLVCVAALSGCDIGVLDPKGPVGAQERQILIDSVAIMLAIVIPTMAAIIGVVWWFRASNPRARYRAELVYSGRVEMVVWAIPTLTVLLLAGVIWIGAHQLDPAAQVEGSGEPLDVQAVSLDWKWLFLYPKQKIASVNQLVAPVGVPLRITLTSGSVMTVFFVPQWGTMIYTMNGMTTHLNLRVDEPGDYLGLAAHLSGEGFSNMRFTARAVSPADFASWVSSAPSGEAFDSAAYKKLSQQGLAQPSVQPLAEPNLFDDITSQKLPPGPGPSPTPRPTSKGS